MLAAPLRTQQTALPRFHDVFLRQLGSHEISERFRTLWVGPIKNQTGNKARQLPK